MVEFVRVVFRTAGFTRLGRGFFPRFVKNTPKRTTRLMSFECGPRASRIDGNKLSTYSSTSTMMSEDAHRRTRQLFKNFWERMMSKKKRQKKQGVNKNKKNKASGRKPSRRKPGGPRVAGKKSGT